MRKPLKSPIGMFIKVFETFDQKQLVGLQNTRQEIAKQLTNVCLTARNGTSKPWHKHNDNRHSGSLTADQRCVL
jgi:hypothetical protein